MAARLPADAAQAEDAAPTVDARVDAAPGSTCGDHRVDDQKEECDPTVDGGVDSHNFATVLRCSVPHDDPLSTARARNVVHDT